MSLDLYFLISLETVFLFSIFDFFFFMVNYSESFYFERTTGNVPREFLLSMMLMVRVLDEAG